MARVSISGLIFLGWLLGPAVVQAEPFSIDLNIEAGKVSKTAHADTAPPSATPKARPVLETKAGDQITIRWKLTNTDPKSTFNDVLVHFYVVREGTAGQRAVPRLDKDVVAETALTMDFKPKDKAEGSVQIHIAQPGSYLVRLEPIATGVCKVGRAPFAALDLVIRQKPAQPAVKTPKP